MRICIVYSGKNNNKLGDIAKALAHGITSQGSHVVDIVDIDLDNDKPLTGYKYLIFGASKPSVFSSKVSANILNYIKHCGHISAKNTFAFTLKGIFSQKFLLNLMAKLEAEGVFLRTSSIIASKEEAEIIGKKLIIK